VTFLNLRVAASDRVERSDAALGLNGLSCRWPPNEPSFLDAAAGWPKIETSNVPNTLAKR